MKSKILVVKYGSSTLTGDSGLDQNKIDSYAAKLNDLRQDYQIVVVSSGAVAAGRVILGGSRQLPRL
ncbi:MAG: hypothetical protein WCH58_01810 [Candidatus Saccharibacteria bacterium]